MLELRAGLPADIALWAGGGAVRNRQKRLPGVRVVDDFIAEKRAEAERE